MQRNRADRQVRPARQYVPPPPPSPSLVSCFSGAPYCGARLREFGDFVAGGDSADQEIRNYYMGGAPLMSDSPFYPEGGASYPTAEFRRL